MSEAEIEEVKAPAIRKWDRYRPDSFYIELTKKIFRGDKSQIELALEYGVSREAIKEWHLKGRAMYREQMETQTQAVLDNIMAGKIAPPKIAKGPGTYVSQGKVTNRYGNVIC